MNVRYFSLLMSFAVVVCLCLFPFGVHAEPQRDQKAQENYNHYEALNDPVRSVIYRPQEVVNAIQLEPHMRILDIGAGAGLFTYLFAEQLDGTGEVVATEIDDGLVRYIDQQATLRSLNNVTAVQVSPRGLDPYYREGRFDLIFICSVYEGIYEPDAYFRALRPSLEPETGRLYLVYANVTDARFDTIDFGDFTYALNTLGARGVEFPLHQRLSDRSRAFLDTWDGRAVIANEIRTTLVDDFNRMLDDPQLFEVLQDYHATIETESYMVYRLRSVRYESRLLARWLIAELTRLGVFSDPDRARSVEEQSMLQRLNRLLVGGLILSEPLQKTEFFGVFLDAEDIIASMNRSGYEFVKNHDILPKHHLLEFKRTDD